MPNNSPHDGSSDTDYNIELHAVSPCQRQRASEELQGHQDTKNPNTKRREYPGPPPKPTKSLREEARGREANLKLIHQRREPQQSQWLEKWSENTLRSLSMNKT
ncbi:MAG: hypothetical protein GY696_25980 [Gammaproteobacteria bacterium]|nr:hypothetical protein [Gammaproteobacteria bacterium]